MGHKSKHLLQLTAATDFVVKKHM